MNKRKFEQKLSNFLLRRIWIILLVVILAMISVFLLMLKVDKDNFVENADVENENLVQRIKDYDYYQCNDYSELMAHCKSVLVHWTDESGAGYVYSAIVNKDNILKVDAKESVQCTVFKNMQTEIKNYWCDEQDVIDWLKENKMCLLWGKIGDDYSMGQEVITVNDIYTSNNGLFIPGEISRQTVSYSSGEQKIIYTKDTDNNISSESDFSYLKGVRYIGNHEIAHKRKKDESTVYIKIYKDYYGVAADSKVYSRVDEKCNLIPHKKRIGDVDVYSEKYIDDAIYSLRTYQGTNVIADNKSRYIAILIITGALSLFISALILLVVFLKGKVSYEKEIYRRKLMDNLAHDLKTPLTAMNGYAENLIDNVADEKRYHYAQSIKDNVDYMNQIIVGVLELSKIESHQNFEMSDINLVESAKKLWDKYDAFALDKKIQMEMNGSYVIKGDSMLINSMLENLISNAIKYGKGDSVIKISGSESSFTVENEVDERIEGDLEKLWQPFEKGDNSRSDRNGSGLGLSIVKDIMDVHKLKGKIICDEGKFRITISCR